MREDELRFLVAVSPRYIIARTKFTIHHFERLNSQSDRGRWKWIAEMSQGIDKGRRDNLQEAHDSYIDGADMFPRLFFNDECLIMEFFSWLRIRNLRCESYEYHT